MNCAALCCVVYAFDESDEFAIDKKENIPCPHLAENNLCLMHATLAEDGFPGCVAYDCYGAGQVIVQDVFKDKNWRKTPDALPDISRAFRRLKRIHEIQALLLASSRLPLDETFKSAMQSLYDALEPPANGWTADNLADFPIKETEERARQYFTSLRQLASSNR